MVVFPLLADGGSAGVVIVAKVDLVVRRGDGAVDLLSCARPGGAAVDALHASILAHAWPGGRPVRVGFWMGDEPAWIEPRDPLWTEAAARAAADRVLAVRPGELAPRAEPGICRSIACSYFAACYPAEAGAAREVHQTTFGFFEEHTLRDRRRRPRGA
jgi:hypothetical protein